MGKIVEHISNNYFVGLLSLLTFFPWLQECKYAKQELNKLRRENGSLDSERHENSKTVSQLQTRVAVLEQELRDKELVFIMAFL